MAKERSLIGAIFKNFVMSLIPRQTKGNFMGSDLMGNKYFEIPANPRLGKRKPSRYFEPTDKDAFDSEMPAEWEAWLRGRRQKAPEEEEIRKNLELVQMAKRNAAEIEKKYPSKSEGIVPQEKKGMESFPQYPEYEVTPGKPKNER